MVLLGPNNGDTSTYIVTPQHVCTLSYIGRFVFETVNIYSVGGADCQSTHHGCALLSTIVIRGPSLVQEKKNPLGYEIGHTLNLEVNQAFIWSWL